MLSWHGIVEFSGPLIPLPLLCPLDSMELTYHQCASFKVHLLDRDPEANSHLLWARNQ